MSLFDTLMLEPTVTWILGGGGSTLYLTDAPDGGYHLTPNTPGFERQMSLAEQIMHDDREILKVLAQ
jgi:hypothetical protein